MGECRRDELEYPTSNNSLSVRSFVRSFVLVRSVQHIGCSLDLPYPQDVFEDFFVLIPCVSFHVFVVSCSRCP